MKGNFQGKIIFYPNWIDNIDTSEELVICPDLPDGFVVMVAGNMGDAQDLPAVMEAAFRLKEYSDIHFVFIGDGRKKEWVDSYIKEKELTETVHCLGRFPREAMPVFFNRATVLLLSLKDTEIFSLTVPSRLQAYMATGKPVVAMLKGEGAEVISEAEDAEKTILSLTGGKGEDVSVEGTGASAPMNLCLNITRASGTVVALGNPGEEMRMEKNSYWKILRRQLKLCGTWNSRFGTENDDWSKVLSLLAEGQLSLEPLITHRLPFDRLREGLEIMRDRGIYSNKVMLLNE